MEKFKFSCKNTLSSYDYNNITQKLDFYENGKIMWIWNFVNGKQNGNSYHFNDKGKLIATQEFKDGAFEGKFIVWYENGVKAREENYVKNKKEGELKQFNEFGDLIRYELWSNDTMIENKLIKEK